MRGGVGLTRSRRHESTPSRRMPTARSPKTYSMSPRPQVPGPVDTDARQVAAASVDRGTWNLMTGRRLKQLLGSGSVAQALNRVAASAERSRPSAIESRQCGPARTSTARGGLLRRGRRRRGGQITDEPSTLCFEQAATIPWPASPPYMASATRRRIEAGHRALIVGASVAWRLYPPTGEGRESARDRRRQRDQARDPLQLGADEVIDFHLRVDTAATGQCQRSGAHLRLGHPRHRRRRERRAVARRLPPQPADVADCTARRRKAALVDGDGARGRSRRASPARRYGATTRSATKDAARSRVANARAGMPPGSSREVLLQPGEGEKSASHRFRRSTGSRPHRRQRRRGPGREARHW